MRWMHQYVANRNVVRDSEIQRSESVITANKRISQAVREEIPDRRTSHTESPSAIGAEPVAWYD